MMKKYPRVLRAIWLICSLIPGLCLWSMQEEKKEEQKWDVAAFTDQTYQIRIDTDEGTWMSVDVSSDGKELVFDLLGDIYIMAIEGGEARALSHGLPWDMQPRFSPDGRRIAFTSDRGGGDNIWTMKRDGSELVEVTKESFRLLNSPAWSPDGNFIAARKHFTGTRSLGAGEIWLYHTAGGKGLQLNKKPNDQKDLGEPAFSADGRYLYFSQDTTPGSTFQYSKDPTPGIYSIKRIDLEDGEIETFIDGMGGAVRPTPSPDGKYLAFIRRKDYDTALYLHHMDSDRNVAVYQHLDRDMQETWAIHGVYANFSWTPDSRALVFWAGGKIRKLDIQTGVDTVIPFHLSLEHTMAKALRFPVEVAPERFDVKMLRWVRISPQEDRVVFQALGHLYIRSPPEGKAHRLTQQNDHFEFYPSFSPDGKFIVYTTWNDHDLGTVRVVPVTGGEGRVLTEKPGQYIEPSFSSDGSLVAYRKVQGGYITSPLWASEPGLYLVGADGKNARLVIKNGSQPRFVKGSERMFFVDRDSDMKLLLKSVDLIGNKERTHAESEMGSELCLSPDGRWIAFVEQFSAYIAPFVITGQPMKLGPKMDNLPVCRVSKDAGEYLHWNGAANRLYWSLGDRLFSRELQDAFAFIAGAPETLPEPQAEGRVIGFQADYDIPSGSVVLKGARLITMNGDKVIENGAIVVRGNRIVALGPVADLQIPRNAHLLDVSGKTIIPGLIDVHAHGAQGSSEIIPRQNWISYAGLTFGVTTIHDPSNDTSTIFAASEMAKAGMITAPRIFSTGTILYGATIPNYTAKVESLDDAAFHLRRMKAVGAFSVKSYNQPRRDQRQQVLVAARDMGLMVVPEGGSLFQHNMTMVADGHTGIEHSIPVAKVYGDVLQFWSQSETFYTPTLGVAYGGISGEHYWYEKTDVWRHTRLSAFVPSYVLEPRARRRTMAPEKEYNHIQIARACKRLLDAGVSVQLGAHGQREGLAAHWELWMFAQGGMTPLEALRCGTLNGARYLGLDGDIGSLEKGKLADLLVLDENPLEDIRNSETVRYVMLNGRLFDAATMNEIGNHPRERRPFFFEDGQGGDSPSSDAWVRDQITCRH